MHILEKHNLLLVSGREGDGKSSLCRAVMRLHTEESVLKLKIGNSKREIDIANGLTHDCLLYFEDGFGRSVYAKDHLTKVNYLFALISKCLQTVSKMKIIVCVRSSILLHVIDKLYSEYWCDVKNMVLNLASPKWKLSQIQRMDILEGYNNHKSTDMRLDKAEMEKICEESNKESYMKFHELCALCFRQTKGTAVFFHPQIQLINEIICLKENEPAEYYMLLYMRGKW